jgi:hypothetical protein
MVTKNALRDFSQPGSYEVLATSFGNTTEKVWAVIYGEVYCNLSPDPEKASRVGAPPPSSPESKIRESFL